MLIFSGSIEDYIALRQQSPAIQQKLMSFATVAERLINEVILHDI